MNIKLIISYDGASYFGWQKTRMGPSIQETLEKGLNLILQQSIEVEAASRTDRGVHAKGQVVCFHWDGERALDSLQYSLNAVLPKDIRVVEIKEASEGFHPTLSAAAKEYLYQICLGPVQEPIYASYSWHISHSLDLDAMRRAASKFMGAQDFSAFTTEKVSDGVRTLFNVEVLCLPENRLEIRLLGDRFLYKMARRIVGTLAEIGKGHLAETIVEELFASPNRAMAGMTAPPHGLFLQQVFYSDTIANAIQKTAPYVLSK